MGVRKLILRFSIVLVFTPVTRSQGLTILVTNPTDFKRPNEPVVISWKAIKEKMPGAAVVGLRDDRKTAMLYQVDDTDLDGSPDELAFAADFAARQRRVFTLALKNGGTARPPQTPPRTDAANWKRINQVLQSVDDDDVAGANRERRLYRFDGVGWESEIIAYRLYLDERNAVDIQGKRKPGLCWKYIGSSGVDYQQDADWGMDVLHVGPALGIGGIGFWYGDSVLKPVMVDRQRTRIIARGPVRAVVRVDYYGWDVGGEKVDVTSQFTIYAGDRVSEHQVTLQKGTAPKKIVTGIVKHPSGKVISNAEEPILVTRGIQSRANDDLVLALVFDRHTILRKLEDQYNQLVLTLLEAQKPLRFLLTSVWQGETGTMWSEAEIRALLNQVRMRLDDPLKIEFR